MRDFLTATRERGGIGATLKMFDLHLERARVAPRSRATHTVSSWDPTSTTAVAATDE
jgi:hypothetical protein